VKALAEMYGKLINREINPMTEVLVTVGAYGSLFATFMSMIGPGDEVILIEPHYDCYRPIVLLAGGKPVHISLKPTKVNDSTSGGWALNMKELEALFNSNTKMIVVNTPNNPLGKVYTRQELQEIGNLCKKYNVVCIADEVYEMNVFPEFEHVRMASLPGMWERTITVGSSGKAFSLTGWKIGWSYGPANLMKNLYVAHQV
jgi:kynurenine--oxoglutarate transaminase/cysteine-S-conjugate beta-lyase/glutamine--phenylpyruvate transaminase